MPRVPKAALVAVEKGNDITGSTLAAAGDNEITPVLKLDGSIDVAATEMKKVHAGGGKLMLGSR
jgi:hypothetical protein